MITDKDIARICVASYDPSFNWDKLWDGASSGGIHVGLKGNILCFRGSVSLLDWFRDLNADAIIDENLGGIHAGFFEGMQECFAEVIQHLHRDSIICGHSLGAARALIFSALMLAADMKPKATIVFGSPRPGFQELADLLSELPIGRSYKNQDDIVTDVPVSLPGLPYVDGLPFRYMKVTRPSGDFGLFSHHHPELYLAGTPDSVIEA